MKAEATHVLQPPLTALDNPPQLTAADASLAYPRGLRSNRHLATHRGQTQIYPYLLLISTTMAAVFCFMYITKPMVPITPRIDIRQVPTPVRPAEPRESPVPTAPSLLPSGERLPGDAQAPPGPKAPARPSLPTTTFEETNLQIQHVLTAETPGGDLSRIVLNVPVVYQSRNLAWTASDVAESRELLKRLASYQSKVRALRDEGNALLKAWNRLVEASVPTTVLRADSPSLTTNQGAMDHAPKPSGLDTAESIKIQPNDK